MKKIDDLDNFFLNQLLENGGGSISLARNFFLLLRFFHHIAHIVHKAQFT